MWERDKEYKKNNYDSILFRVKKGKKAEYQQAASELGLGKMELMRVAVEEYIAHRRDEKSVGSRDADLSPVDTNNAPITCKQPEQNLSTEQKQLIEEFNKLPVETQKAFLKLFTLINQNSKQNSFPE